MLQRSETESEQASASIGIDLEYVVSLNFLA